MCIVRSGDPFYLRSKIRAGSASMLPDVRLMCHVGDKLIYAGLDSGSKGAIPEFSRQPFD